MKDLPNEFMCRCKDNYLGQFCRYGKYCHSSPCRNGGSCIEGPSTFLCHCPSEFTGRILSTALLSNNIITQLFLCVSQEIKETVKAVSIFRSNL